MPKKTHPTDDERRYAGTLHTLYQRTAGQSGPRPPGYHVPRLGGPVIGDWQPGRRKGDITIHDPPAAVATTPKCPADSDQTPPAGPGSRSS
jgi:hypothetical protein